MDQVSHAVEALLSRSRSLTHHIAHYPLIRQLHALFLPFLALISSTWLDTSYSRTPTTCPDYTTYSQTPHGIFSDGPLRLPYMRPDPACRTFNSSAVEKVISDMTSRLRDPDLAMLFANTFPSTLDTTVKYFDEDKNLAFIITGDINAQWLRDTGNQFAHLHKLLPLDSELQALVKAVINTESRYIAAFPYCGAFQPPKESGLKTTLNAHGVKVTVNPPIDDDVVFECKFELDSLSAFLKLSRSYYTNTKDGSFINQNCESSSSARLITGLSAMNQIITVLQRQSLSSFDDDWNFISHFNWTGTEGSLSPPVPNGGNGEPRKANGLVSCTHRPSDDLCVFNYITADNAMMSVELNHIAEMLESLGVYHNISSISRQYASTIRKAIYDHTIASTGIFAYETNGYGGQYIMDDANVPSLVSLPYLGFLDKSDPLYIKTKDALFSPANPYYTAGPGFEGIGGPHIHATFPWPMSQVSAIFGTDDDKEIEHRLYTIINNTAGLGLIHEAVNTLNSSDYTRPWFAWTNSYFAEMVLDLAERKPGLVLRDDMPYRVGQ